MKKFNICLVGKKYVECFFLLDRYQEGEPALTLVGAEKEGNTPYEICDVTEYVSPLEPDSAYISEPESRRGLTEQLVRLGFAERTGQTAVAEARELNLVRLNLALIREYSADPDEFA